MKRRASDYIDGGITSAMNIQVYVDDCGARGTIATIALVHCPKIRFRPTG